MSTRLLVSCVNVFSCGAQFSIDIDEVVDNEDDVFDTLTLLCVDCETDRDRGTE